MALMTMSLCALCLDHGSIDLTRTVGSYCAIARTRWPHPDSWDTGSARDRPLADSQRFCTQEFEAEARVLQQVQHACCTKTFGWATEFPVPADGVYCLVQEFVGFGCAQARRPRPQSRCCGVAPALSSNEVARGHQCARGSVIPRTLTFNFG